MGLTYFLIVLALWIPFSVGILRYYGGVSTWDLADGEDKFFSLLFGMIAAALWPLTGFVSLFYGGFMAAFKLTESKK